MSALPACAVRGRNATSALVGRAPQTASSCRHRSTRQSACSIYTGLQLPGVHVCILSRLAPQPHTKCIIMLANAHKAKCWEHACRACKHPGLHVCVRCREVAVRQTRSSCQQMLTGQGADSIYLLCLQPPALYVCIRSGPYSKQHHRPCKRSKVHCLQHIMGLLLPGICREHACMHAWRSIMSHMRTGMRRSRARGRTSAEAGHPQLATGPSGGQRLRWVACRGQGGDGKERWQLRERPVMKGENK